VQSCVAAGLLAIAATATPLVMPEATFAADTVKVGTCLLQKCQRQLAQVRAYLLSYWCDALSAQYIIITVAILLADALHSSSLQTDERSSCFRFSTSSRLL
jgi:hypothetical protein